MTPAERETVLKNLTDSRERLLRVAQGLSREQLHYRPAEGRWSVAENIEHLTFVEGRVFGFIQKTLSEGPSTSKRSAVEDGKDSEFAARIAERTDRFQAPEPVRPCGRWADDQLLKEFESTRQRTHEFARTTDADLRAHFFTHGRFGDLDLYQWLLLIAAHCDRHRAQSEEVIASAGFPEDARKSARG